MKMRIILGLIFAIVILGAACGQASNTDHSKMDHNSMNHNSNRTNSNGISSNMPMNHNSEDHSGMKSDPNAANAPFDLQFIDTMSDHHAGAVRMAELVVKKTQNEELKNFAQKIIDDQRQEISQMEDWRKQWFADAKAAKNMAMPGMADSMKMMEGGMKKMETAEGKQFDLLFLEMMIPHHEGAVVMAKEALRKSEKAEIKTLAGSIIKAQESEIKQMTDWKAKWSK